jgi:hypothetical protein
MKFKKGDRVKDKFKKPRPGDELVEGEVILVTDTYTVVKWDARPMYPAELTHETADELLEKVEE